MKHTQTDRKQAPSANNGEYEYVSAGVKEKPGRVPVWLMTVICGLFIWGGYYLIAYWNPQ